VCMFFLPYFEVILLWNWSMQSFKLHA
jgi:hypothetical protein